MSARYSARRPRARMVLGFAAALGAASGIVGTLATGTAAAKPASTTLHYTCTFPTIGGEPITATISTDIPTTLAVGEPSRPFAITAVATVNATFATGLHYALGVSTMEGTLDAETSVTAPQGVINIPVHLAITTTGIPAFASVDIPATGTAPTLTFTKPGSARITAGNFTLHLIPLDANGNITNPGKINVPCTLNPGQDNVVTSFNITGTKTTTDPTASGTPGAPSTARPTGPATAAPTPHSTTGSPASDGSGTATALPATTTTPDPTGSTINAAATGATSTSGPGTGILILLAAGILAAAAAALRFGLRLKGRHRPDEDG